MQPLIIDFMALLLAHLLGDFVLQTQWIAQNKSKSTGPLLVHGCIHWGLAWVSLLVFAPVQFLSFWSQFLVFTCITIHLAIDLLKSRLTAQHTLPDNAATFLGDQSLHVATLVIASILLSKTPPTEILLLLHEAAPFKTRFLEVAVIYSAIVFGGGYLIRYLTKGIAKGDSESAQSHMRNAGLYVGWIERFLMLTAVVLQSPVLVGLILTGKSLARFPEFKKAQFAEYFLIGTLLSISLSLLGGILLLQLLYGTISLK